MRKILSVIMALIATATCTFGIVGCNNSNKYSNITRISFLQTGGCMGLEWIQELIDEYEELNKETEFEPNKKGVVVEPTKKHDLANGDLSKTSTYDIISLEYVHVNEYVQEDKLVDLTELYSRPSKYSSDGKSIIERMLPEMRGSSAVVSKDATGAYKTNFYALPHYEFMSGLTYDKELFDRYNLYFAEDQSADSDGFLVETNFGDAYFIGEDSGEDAPIDGVELSYGPDFTKGTADDGLPKSLQELAILCAHMKNDCDIEPMQYPGGKKDYSNILVCGLYASLAGYEALQATSTFKGNLEVINTNDIIGGQELIFDETTPLFEGATGIAKPQTRWVQIDQAVDNTTGWYTQELAAKYYALAFYELAYNNEWFSSATRTNGLQSHTDSQASFMLNGQQVGNTLNPNVGMLVENTYLWNEMDVEGVLDTYTKYAATQKDPYKRDIRVMPLPSVLTNADYETANVEGRRTDWSNTMVDTGTCMLLVSKKNVENEAHTEAIFDFLDFLYSKENLIKFTKKTGMYKPLDYELEESDKQDLSIYSKSVLEMRENGKIVRHSGDNPVFVLNGASLSINIWGTTWQNAAGVAVVDTLMESQKQGQHLMRDLFEHKRMSQATWKNYVNALGTDTDGQTIKWIDFGLDESTTVDNLQVQIIK